MAQSRGEMTRRRAANKSMLMELTVTDEIGEVQPEETPLSIVTDCGQHDVKQMVSMKYSHGIIQVLLLHCIL